MLSKCVLLAAAAAFVAVEASSAIDADLLKKVIRYEAQKAEAEAELAEIQQIVANMRAAAGKPAIQVAAMAVETSTGSGSSTSEATVGSGSGDDEYAIETPPVATSKPPATEESSGSSASDASVTTAPTPAPTTSAAVSIQMVAPAAFAAVAAAFTLL